MLSTQDVADHFDLDVETVRRRARSGDIPAVRFRRTYRFDWRDVWSCERGPMPKGPRQARYKDPLLSKARIASKLSVSRRTIERWIEGGLPTRNVFGSVRCNPHDVTDWCQNVLGVDLHEHWWKE